VSPYVQSANSSGVIVLFVWTSARKQCAPRAAYDVSFVLLQLYYAA
jgi:hypothetical protein